MPPASATLLDLGVGIAQHLIDFVIHVGVERGTYNGRVILEIRLLMEGFQESWGRHYLFHGAFFCHLLKERGIDLGTSVGVRTCATSIIPKRRRILFFQEPDGSREGIVVDGKLSGSDASNRRINVVHTRHVHVGVTVQPVDALTITIEAGLHVDHVLNTFTCKALGESPNRGISNPSIVKLIQCSIEVVKIAVMDK